MTPAYHPGEWDRAARESLARSRARRAAPATSRLSALAAGAAIVAVAIAFVVFASLLAAGAVP